MEISPEYIPLYLNVNFTVTDSGYVHKKTIEDKLLLLPEDFQNRSNFSDRG